MLGIPVFLKNVPGNVVEVIGKIGLRTIQEREVLAQLSEEVWLGCHTVLDGVTTARHQKGQMVPWNVRGQVLGILEDGEHVEVRSLGSLSQKEVDVIMALPSGVRRFVDDHYYRRLTG